MSTTSTAGPGTTVSTATGRSLLRAAAIGAAAATLVNGALWAGGRAADVSFSVTSPMNDTAFEVGIALIVLTTLLSFAAAAGLLALAVRRSRRSVRVVLVVAVLVAVLSAGSPLSAADDTGTGVLLATMHLVTGAAFLATGRRAGG